MHLTLPRGHFDSSLALRASAALPCVPLLYLLASTAMLIVPFLALRASAALPCVPLLALLF